MLALTRREHVDGSRSSSRLSGPSDFQYQRFRCCLRFLACGRNAPLKEKRLFGCSVTARSWPRSFCVCCTCNCRRNTDTNRIGRADRARRAGQGVAGRARIRGLRTSQKARTRIGFRRLRADGYPIGLGETRTNNPFKIRQFWAERGLRATASFLGIINGTSDVRNDSIPVSAGLSCLRYRHVLRRISHQPVSVSRDVARTRTGVLA